MLGPRIVYLGHFLTSALSALQRHWTNRDVKQTRNVNLLPTLILCALMACGVKSQTSPTQNPGLGQTFSPTNVVRSDADDTRGERQSTLDITLILIVLIVILCVGICLALGYMFHKFCHRRNSDGSVQDGKGCYNIRSDQIGITFTLDPRIATNFTDFDRTHLESEFLTMLKRGSKYQRFAALFEEDTNPQVSIDFDSSTALLIITRPTSGERSLAFRTLVSRAASKDLGRLQRDYVEFLRQKVHRWQLVLSVHEDPPSRNTANFGDATDPTDESFHAPNSGRISEFVVLNVDIATPYLVPRKISRDDLSTRSDFRVAGFNLTRWHWQQNNEQVDVIVKEPRERRFLIEAGVMAKYGDESPYLVRLFGIASPTMLVMEDCFPAKTLKKYLMETNDVAGLSDELLTYCYQVASGLEHCKLQPRTFEGVIYTVTDMRCFVCSDQT